MGTAGNLFTHMEYSMISQILPSRKSLIVAVFGDRGVAYFWETRFLPKWLPLLLGLSLGMLLALLIVSQAWHFLIFVTFAVPAIVLLIRYPFIAVMVWLVVFPFFVRGASVADRYVYWIVHRALIPAALGIAILSDGLRVRKKEPVRFGGAELAMLIFVGLAPANIFLFTQDPQQMVYRLFDRVFVPFCAYWLIRLTALREKNLKLLLGSAFITVVVQSVIGLLAWFAPQVLPPQWLTLQGARTVGTFGNAATYTSTLLFLSLLLFQYAMNCKPSTLRLVLLFTFGLALFCVSFSFSRGSWLGGLVVLVGLIFIYPKTVIRLIMVIAALAYILSSSVLADEVAFAWERLTGEESINSAEGRMITNNASLKMIEAKPLWGWGYGNYDRHDYQFYSRVGNIRVSKRDKTSHNTYLSIMAEMGLIGFLLYIFPVGWWFVLSIKTWRRLPKDGFWSGPLLVMLWLLLLDHIIVSNFMDMFRFNHFGTTIFWMALGLIANLVCPYLRPGGIGAPSWARQPGGLI
jgi:O-antigen ligase